MVDHPKSKGLGVLTDTEWASKFGVEPSSEALRKEEITLTSKGEGLGAPDLQSLGERAEEAKMLELPRREEAMRYDPSL